MNADDLSAQLVNAGIPINSQSDAYQAGGTTFFDDVLSTVPGVGQSMAMTMGRGSNTILFGGQRSKFGGRFKNMPEKGFSTSPRRSAAIRNNLNPFRRMMSQDVFFGEGYTPFNFADMGNKGISALQGKSDTRIGRRMAASAAKNPDSIAAKLASGDVDQMFVKGSLSRLSAANRIGNMSTRQFESRILGNGVGNTKRNRTALDGMRGGRKVQNLRTFLDRSGVNVGALDEIADVGARKAAYQRSLAGTGGQFNGFANAARMGETTGSLGEFTSANTSAQKGMRSVTQAADTLGFRSADDAGYKARHVIGRTFQGIRGNLATEAGEQVGKRAAAKAGGKLLAGKAAAMIGSRAIPFIGWAMLAYDVAKLTANTAWRTANLAAEAYGSYTKDISKGAFQTGFKDNEASYTSRQRGVQAIANSRLNARSILGNEAAALAQHFG